MASTKTSRDPANPKPARKRAAPRTTSPTTKAGGESRTVAALAEVDNGDEDVWTLRLYVAGDSPKSRAALSNLQRLCDAHLEGKYKIEVVDLKTRPELAKADQILALPTLIRKIPEPMKRLIGDLSNAERALLALDLGDRAPASKRAD